MALLGGHSGYMNLRYFDPGYIESREVLFGRVKAGFSVIGKVS